MQIINGPLISVIIPVYNVEKYIKRCVKSVINQTYKNIEIILIDDGSPDNSGKICDEYAKKDPRIKVLHKKNGGLSDARNQGISIANGEYISFIDSDDEVSSDYIDYLYSLCKKENAEVSCCSYFRSDKEINDFPKEYDKKILVLNNKNACKELLSNHYIVLVTACWKLYKTELVKQNLFPKGRTHEDEATTFKYYYEAKRVVIGKKACYMYYNNPESITNKDNNKINNDIIWALNHRTECFIEMNEIKLARMSAKRLFSYLCDFYKNDRTIKGEMEWFEKKYVFSKYLGIIPKIRFELLYRILD